MHIFGSSYTRRMWIEIFPDVLLLAVPLPSSYTRRMWIEIGGCNDESDDDFKSSYTRRMWIEIVLFKTVVSENDVILHT